MKLLLMRHGETFWNTEGRLQGQTDIPLDEEGIRMAVSCGRGMKAVPVDLCISSPLCRAIKTSELVIQENEGYGPRARLLLQEMEAEKAPILERAKLVYAAPEAADGLQPVTAQPGAFSEAFKTTRGLPYLTDDRLKEASFGPWEGLICKAEGYNVPLEDFSVYWQNPDSPLIPKEVEKLTAVADRVTDFLKDLTASRSLQDKNILLMVHGCVMRSVMYICNGRNSFTGKVPYNCEVMVCEPVGRDGLKELSRHIYYDKSMIHDYYATMKQE